MRNIDMKLARMEKNLTQTELAKIVGTTRQTVGLIEKGEYNTTISMGKKICRALDKTLNDLFWTPRGD